MSSLGRLHAAGQRDKKFGSLTDLCFELQRSTQLRDDAVTDRQAKARALARGLGGEKWIEHFCLNVERNSLAGVFDAENDATVFFAGRDRDLALVSLDGVLRV